MKPLSFMVYAHGRKIHARLVKQDGSPRHGDCYCHKCNSNQHMTFLAEAVQYGFITDMHWDVYNCSECQCNTAFQYEIELSLAKAVERLR